MDSGCNACDVIRSAWFVCFSVLACSSPDSALFDSPSGSGGTQGSGGTVAVAGSGAAASGGMSTGGTGTTAGENAGAMPGAGTAGTGEPVGDGGAGTDPMGTAGADDGAGGGGDLPVEPECGNGKLEGDEECDDGGHVGQDGCTAECRVLCSDFGEGTVESEDHHCYNGYDEADFEGAQQDCMDRGAHLVTISSDSENDIAQTFVNNSKFIGGFEQVDLMSDASGTYQWVTGEPFTFTNWDENNDEPDRNGTRCSASGPISQQCYEHCARIIGTGLWTDQRCDLEDGYICEWEPAGS